MQEMSWGTLGTVRPFPNFHPDRDVAEIQSALERKGASAATSLHHLQRRREFTLLSRALGSDAAALVRVLTNRSNDQRQEIVKTFKEITQKVIIIIK